MIDKSIDQEKIKRLESALLSYIERYGLTENAKAALANVREAQKPFITVIK